MVWGGEYDWKGWGRIFKGLKSEGVSKGDMGKDEVCCFG